MRGYQDMDCLRKIDPGATEKGNFNPERPKTAQTTKQEECSRVVHFSMTRTGTLLDDH
jgi:hypothetical protein